MRSTRPLRPWLLVPTFLAGLCLAREGAAQEVVHHWRKTVWPDGRVEVEMPVTELADWLDSGAGSIDLRELVDSRGRRYRMEAEAYQTDEQDPVRYEIRLRLDPERTANEEELERTWLAYHPDATPAELGRFRARRADPRPTPPSGPMVEDALLDWARTASARDRRDVVVLLREQTPFALPRLGGHLFQSEPAFALSQLEARLLAVEARKTALELSQAPIVTAIEEAGGELLRRYWLLDGFECRVGPDALRELLREPRVELLEVVAEALPDDLQGAGHAGAGGASAATSPTVGVGSVSAAPEVPGAVASTGNTLRSMRTAVQASQFHDAGYEGEVASGINNVGDMFLAVIDTTVDQDHPAWKDGSTGPSRLAVVWRNIAGIWAPVTTSATSGPSHGTGVSGIAVGDLTQKQDPNVLDAVGQGERTGLAPEASFTFVEVGDTGLSAALEFATLLAPDTINVSMSLLTTMCSLNHSSNEFVDAAMLDGAFVAKSAGNNGNAGSACTIGTPGAASGAFTVGAIDETAKPLQSGSITSSSSRGGDAIGRAVVALTAPTGPEVARTAAFDDDYSTFNGTSGATPVVAGSAIVLKEHLVDLFGGALVNEVGFQYAALLLMGDRFDGTGTGGIGGGPDPIDDLYGVGRLRLRMFNAAGMDAPWKVGLFSRLVSDGDLIDDMPVNANPNNVNMPIPDDVEGMRVAAFWHEPNLEFGAPFTADIGLYYGSEAGLLYGSGNSLDNHQRLGGFGIYANGVWSIKLLAGAIPPSLDSNYYYLKPVRMVYVAYLWEDIDRDDADGPGSEIQ